MANMTTVRTAARYRTGCTVQPCYIAIISATWDSPVGFDIAKGVFVFSVNRNAATFDTVTVGSAVWSEK